MDGRDDTRPGTANAAVKASRAPSTGKKKLGDVFLDGMEMLCIALTVLIIVGHLVGFRLCSIQSGSMEPAIPTHSLCLVDTRVRYEELEVGDVVVYHRAADNRDIVHRIVAITPAGAITRGDANVHDDGVSVTPQTLYAKYLGHIPYAGLASDFVKKFRVAVLILVALLSGTILYSLWRAWRKQPARRE